MITKDLKKLISVLLILLTAIFLVSLSVSAAEPRLVLRSGDDSTEEYPYHIAFAAWAEAIDKASNGEIKLEVYSNAVLGYERELIEGVQMGTIDFCTTSLGPFGSFAPQINVLSLPYIFKDVDHLVRVLDSGLSYKMNAYIEEQNVGFISLGWICGGGRCFYTKKPVYSVKDLANLKIRVMENDVYINMVNLIGAKAVPMAYGEVYSALQTGVLDGAENDFGAYYTQKHYEGAPYYALDMHTIDITGLLVSTKTWEKLSEADKIVLLQTLPAFIEAGRESWAKLTIDAREAVEKLGATITEVDKEEFKKAVTPMWETAVKEYGSEFFDFVMSVE